MGNVAVIEDVARWPTLAPTMYEVPNVNCQNFNNMNYPVWGQMPFGEANRRRNNRTGGKPHHHNSRRNNHQQQQAAWSADCGPAPASPQWQPQPPPPPPAEPSFHGFQEPQGPVAVNLQGLPPALCRQNFLEAMLDQAGLANEIMGCVLGQDQETGKAVIYLADYNAALKCVQHFGGRRWDNAGPPVTAQVAEGEETPTESAPPAKAVGGRNRKQRGVKHAEEQQFDIPQVAPIAEGLWAMPQPVLPIMAIQGYYKGSDLSPETAGSDSPKAGSTGSNSPKVCWADLTDEDEKENDLSEGLEGSTSAGSSTRHNSKDTVDLGGSFFFGCDVDTDDGF